MIGGTDPSQSGYDFTRLEVAETLIEVDDQARPRQTPLRPGLRRAPHLFRIRWELA